MMEKAGFETIQMRNLEGVGTLLTPEQAKALEDPEKKKAWFDVLRLSSENPDLLGRTIHFLYVGQPEREGPCQRIYPKSTLFIPHHA